MWTHVFRKGIIIDDDHETMNNNTNRVPEILVFSCVLEDISFMLTYIHRAILTVEILRFVPIGTKKVNVQSIKHYTKVVVTTWRHDIDVDYFDYMTVVVTTWLHDNGGDYLTTWQWWWLLDYMTVVVTTWLHGSGGDYLITRQWWWLLDYMTVMVTTWLHDIGGDYLISCYNN